MHFRNFFLKGCFLPARPARSAILLIAALAAAPAWERKAAVTGDDWLPITPEELAMTAEPQAPGAPAIYLYRQVDRDDNAARENVYARIKILTEEGRKYADVDIPFFKDRVNVNGIRARSIRPNGSAVNFDDKVYEKTIVKARGVSYLAKTFTIPDVQPGSIIEYRYTSAWDPGFIYDSRWVLSEELFTKRAKFSLQKYGPYALRLSWPRALPPGTSPPSTDSSRVVRLETRNVPAVTIEDFMPPELETKYYVDFVYYMENTEKEPSKFWEKEGKQRYVRVEDFVGKRKAMEQAVAQVVSSGDAPETSQGASTNEVAETPKLQWSA